MSHSRTIPAPGCARRRSPPPVFQGYEYICCDCQRIERTPSPITPLDWHIVEHDCSGCHTIRCPDCNEAIEQRHFVNHVVIDELAFVPSALVAAQAAAEVIAELMRFQREGKASASMPFTVDLAGEIAEAFCQTISICLEVETPAQISGSLTRVRKIIDGLVSRS